MRELGRRRSVIIAIVAVAAIALLGACQPERPSAGRGTPVRKVLILGDSITWGLFGTTPRLHERLTPTLDDRGISTRILGFAGGNILEPWPGQGRWIDELGRRIDAWNPDVVIIQSTLFPGGADADRQDQYERAARQLFQRAGSRGAHVYRVSHGDPPGSTQRRERDIAERIQARVAGPGVSAIPLDWWLERCSRPYSSDRWHLSGAGQDCHALAIAVAIDQLRARNG